MELAIIVWILFGVVTAVAASNRGRSGCNWFAIGFLLGPFGLIPGSCYAFWRSTCLISKPAGGIAFARRIEKTLPVLCRIYSGEGDCVSILWPGHTRQPSREGDDNASSIRPD